MVLLLVLLSALTLNSHCMELEREAEALDLLKSFEFTSYNLLFDLCGHLKASGNFTSLHEAREGISLLAERWCSRINSYEKGAEVYSSVVHVGSLLVEEYSGQEVDIYQMRYAGVTGDERWLVTGKVYVEFWGSGMLFRASHTIRLAI